MSSWMMPKMIMLLLLLVINPAQYNHHESALIQRSTYMLGRDMTRTDTLFACPPARKVR